MNTKYMAEYRGSLGGCLHRFTPIGKEDQMFEPQVEHLCPLCEKKHLFRLARIHMVSTPHQLKTFLDWCETNSIQRGVNL